MQPQQQSAATLTSKMYTVTGANLHGQWFTINPKISKFETITNIRNNVSFDLDQNDLVYIGWSYNLFRDNYRFYLSGSWNGNIDKLIEVPLPKVESVTKDTHFLLTGNDYNLFLFDTNLLTMWVIDLEHRAALKKVNLNTEMPLADEAKRLRSDNNIVKVCASNLTCVCLTAQGAVYSGALPSPLDIRGVSGKICDIQCGYEHCLMLTNKGHVYSWGNGRRLQLGHGDLNDIETPTQIEALGGINIIKISTGGWHSLALSESGDVYAWGWNDIGQLGLRENEHISEETSDMNGGIVQSYSFPTLVDIYDSNGDVVSSNVKSVACGSRHSAILLEDNSVWMTGCNRYGQLGFETETFANLRTFKKSYQCSSDASLKCGPWVTVIVNIVQSANENS